MSNIRLNLGGTQSIWDEFYWLKHSIKYKTMSIFDKFINIRNVDWIINFGCNTWVYVDMSIQKVQ